jgi:hypothetical protein
VLEVLAELAELAVHVAEGAGLLVAGDLRLNDRAVSGVEIPLLMRVNATGKIRG